MHCGVDSLVPHGFAHGAADSSVLHDFAHGTADFTAQQGFAHGTADSLELQGFAHGATDSLAQQGFARGTADSLAQQGFARGAADSLAQQGFAHGDAGLLTPHDEFCDGADSISSSLGFVKSSPQGTVQQSDWGGGTCSPAEDVPRLLVGVGLEPPDIIVTQEGATSINTYNSYAKGSTSG